MTMVWTKERVAFMLERRAEGIGMKEIAAEIGFGCTKNMIIGKLRRLDAEERGDSDRLAAEARARARAASAEQARIRHNERERRRFRRSQRPTPVAVPLEEPPAIGPVGDLVEGLACRWVHGDPATDKRWRQCGHGSHAGSPYCAFHFRKSYAPQPKRAA